VNHGDAQRAEKLMLHHLDHIEQSLKLDDSAEEVNLESVFS
jgi:DNA-binding GntR family transcriptional regulator